MMLALYKGALRACVLLCAFLSVSTYAQTPPLELEKLSRLTDAQATLKTVFKGFNRGTKESVYELELTNVSGSALAGPVYATIEGISGGVTVKNPSAKAHGWKAHEDLLNR
jgi:hypothetical protein